jgi:hypothetical protein
MAQLSGIQLVDPGTLPSTSGAVFRSSGAPRIDALAPLPAGASAEVRSGTPIVVTRDGNAANHTDALFERGAA